MEVWHYIIAILGGFLAGSINTLAGNGSAITLTILTEVLGLPGNVANGTNRVGIFSQSLIGTYTFYRHGKLNLQRTTPIIIVIAIGAIAGIIVANLVESEQFKAVFRFLMVLMLIVILVKPRRWLRETNPDRKLNWWIVTPIFLALGFYGGFIQMGMGIFLLAVMVLIAHYSLVESNAVKLAVVGLYTIFALILFQLNGYINWKFGLLLAVGQTAGAWLTASFAAQHPRANVWAHRLLVAVVILAIVRLFRLYEYLGIYF